MSVLHAFAAFLVPVNLPALPPAETIAEVVCIDRKGDIYSGTAFRIGPGEMITVNHVVDTGDCFIGANALAGNVWNSPKADFASVSLDATIESGPSIPVDCNGFVKGHRYAAIGFAGGLSTPTVVELVATGDHDKDGQAALVGVWTAEPGMSGGPIIDEDTGKVVGTNDAASFEDETTYSVELKGTPICAKPTARFKLAENGPPLPRP